MLDHDEWLLRVRSPFHIFRSVWDSDDLHFGLFEREDEELLHAVERMSRFLSNWVPETPCRILDLGTGFGNTACRLAAHGHRVIGVAPDPALIEYACELADRKGFADRTEFHALPFEAVPWEIDQPFDLVFSQESLQYLRDLAMTFHHLEAITHPKARLIISDQVRRDDSAGTEVQFHRAERIVQRAERSGFRLVHHEDLTARTLPTLVRTLQDLERARTKVLDHFRGVRDGVEAEFDEIVAGGTQELDLFRSGAAGYELFVFDKARGLGG